MLNVPAEFPHVGSEAFLAPEGERVRIQRRNEDEGTAFIELLPDARATRAERRSLAARASGNTTVDLTRLFATPGEALGLTSHAEPQHKRARRRSPTRRSAK